MLGATKATPPLTRPVRRAVASEAASLARLINRASEVERAFLQGERTDPDEVQRLQETGQFLVVESQGGDLAATVYLEVEPGRGRFAMLSVQPELQGSGLGRRLIAVAELLCQAEGCEAIDIEVVNLREELPPFYRSLGYQTCGTRAFDDDRLERPAHYICMRKALPRA